MPSPFFTTGPRGLVRSLLGTSNIDDIDAGFLAMATDIETKMVNYASGLASALPAAGVDGRVYRETDSGRILLDNGAAWVPLNLTFVVSTVSLTVKPGTVTQMSNGGTTATLPAAPPGGTICGVRAGNGASGASPITVASAAGMYGLGLNAVTSFALGTPQAHVLMVYDAANTAWRIISGEQNTGWVPLTLPAQMSAAAGYYVPAARLIGDGVTLRGGIKYAVANPPSFGPYGTVATAGMFPVSTVGVPLSLQSGNTIGGQITTSGAIQSANGSVTAGDIVQLDGLNYSLA